MLFEKKKLLIHRLIWGIAFAVSVIAVIAMIIALIKPEPETQIELVSDSGYILEYWEYLEETECEIDIVFDGEVDNGTLTVEFFDPEGDSLGVYTESFYAFGSRAEVLYFVDGMVDSYRIVDYYYTVYDYGEFDSGLYYAVVIVAWISFCLLLMFIGALMLSCKVYQFEGHQIIVYAGFCHHYIKIDDEKYDEHNTILTFSPINMSCVVGEHHLEATVTLTNRISLKIDGRLCDPV